MSKPSEKRDPDEIILAPHAGVGGAGRIPVIGRVSNGAQPVDDEDEDGFDLSIESSLRAVQIAWRDLYELKGALSAAAIPASPGLDHAWSVIDGLDSWFDSQEKRLQLMLDRRGKSGGAS